MPSCRRVIPAHWALVLVYYSTYVFVERDWFTISDALLVRTPALTCAFKSSDRSQAGMGFGIINFVFALPAVWTIDTFGRRNLLLVTFPFMAIFHGFIAIALGVGNKGPQTAVLLVGVYLFAVAYSPGEGPVPFVSHRMPALPHDSLMLFRGLRGGEHASL